MKGPQGLQRLEQKFQESDFKEKLVSLLGLKLRGESFFFNYLVKNSKSDCCIVYVVSNVYLPQWEHII